MITLRYFLQLNNSKATTVLDLSIPESGIFVSPIRVYHIVLNLTALPECEEASHNCGTSLSIKTSAMSPAAPCNYRYDL